MGIGDRQSQSHFARVPQVNMGRSQFDRSFGMKDIFYFDLLTPIFLDEVLPGDTANVSMSAFARLATQLVPIMDNLYIDFFFFYVPNRLVWEHWEKFCGAQDNPGDSISYVVPSLTTFGNPGPLVNTIFEKMGLPINCNQLSGVNAMPFRAYNLIWNEWFRDQNLQDSVTNLIDDGPDSPSDYQLLYRGKRHDYLTSCLPSPQKGVAVGIPLGTSVPITRASNALQWKAFESGTNVIPPSAGVSTEATTGYLINAIDTLAYSLDPNGGLTALMSNMVSPPTINSLRQAFQIQSLLELDNRGGTRFTEILQAHFNVTSPDFRLQRPEYLGGGSMQINSHPVPQTAPTSGSNYQGQLAAFATASSRGPIGFTKSFVEHGYVLGLACPRADITYQQSLARLWTRSTRYDFFWPKLQELGEQAVLNQEIWCQGATAGSDLEVFGYQERYAEYKYKFSEIHGEFRSNYSAPLDYWHMAEYFGSLPTLNTTFIQQSTPITRALANSSAPQVLFDCFFKYKHARPMLTYAVPASLGRF